MTVRWYIMPAEVVVVGGKTIRRPEFLTTIAPSASWGWLPVKDNWGIGWVDLDSTQHATYTGSAGVRFLTADLANTLGAGAVTQVQAFLSGRNLPSAWVDTSDTWGQVIKRVMCFVLLIQRYYGETSQSLNVGLPVDTDVATLPQNARTKLDAVSSTMSLSAVVPGDTIETMMMRWSDELMLRPIFVGGVEL